MTDRRSRVLAAAVTLLACATLEAAPRELAVSAAPPVPDVPSWVHHAVFYQIYPQSFYDSNGDGIGDLQGIIDKLDYVKSLGVDAVWINPFFDSPFHDAGYDVRDYYRVAPRYGTNEDARRLFAEAHARGLRVLFDYVVSYTAIDHPWFVDSARQQPNPRWNWYVWTDNVWKPEAGELGTRLVNGYGQRHGSYLRNFFWCQPALNFGFHEPDPAKKWQLPVDHPDVLALREELTRVLRFWMDMGADGFRADMAGALVKGAGSDRDTLGFWREIREILRKDYPEAFMVAEWSGPKDALDGAFHADFFHWFDGYNDLAQKESWRILNGYSEGHSFFDEEGKGDISHFLARYLEQYQATRGKGYISLPLGNHDIARLNVRRTPEELEAIMAFGITMPGVPFIYYGNEIGMRQLHGLPQIEGCYEPRAGARTPMQWTSGENRGFSSAAASRLWLPVDPAEDAPNVADQENDEDSLLSRVRALVRLKHVEPALAAHADFLPLHAKESTYPFVYARTHGGDAVLAAFNPAAVPVTAEFACPIAFEKTRLLAGRASALSRSGGRARLEMAGRSYALFKLE